MGIALHAQRSASRVVALGVERVAVVSFNAVISVEEVAIAAEHAAAIGGRILDAVVSGALYEATERLHRHFILVRGFRLRKRWQRRGGDAYDPCDDRFLSQHLIAPLFYRTLAFLLLFASTSVRLVKGTRHSNRPNQ